MEDLCALIIFVIFILGGSCSLAGTWWSKNKKKKENEKENENK